jgi:Ni,Fe-hydrogenase III large subunit
MRRLRTPVVEVVEPARWRAACTAAVDDGARFLSLHATADGPAATVRALFADAAARLRLVSTTAPDRTVDTLVDAIPAAAWDEREAHDVFGVGFRGHEPLRPLVHHPRDSEAWTTPVHGDDVHQVAVGPVHAGIVESGHFRFHTVGERIVHLDTQLFHKHRGLERGAEGESFESGLAFAQRACAACAVANGVAYAQACEALLGLQPDRHVRRARTLLLELERLYNHLNDFAAICAGIGFAPGTMAFAELKERAQRVNAALAGHRFLFDAVRVGHSDLTVGGRAADGARAEVRAIFADAAACWREVAFSASVQERFAGTGVLSGADAARLGTVGPAARASGIARDARAWARSLLWYGDDFHPARPHATTGDVAARAEQRAVELAQTGEILDELLAGTHEAGAAPTSTVASEVGVGRVESPRGETVCVVERAGSRVRRLRLRTGSYANWPALAHCVPGNLLPDFPLVNKSFELCYACVDR